MQTALRTLLISVPYIPKSVRIAKHSLFPRRSSKLCSSRVLKFFIVSFPFVYSRILTRLFSFDKYICSIPTDGRLSINAPAYTLSPLLYISQTRFRILNPKPLSVLHFPDIPLQYPSKGARRAQCFIPFVSLLFFLRMLSRIL